MNKICRCGFGIESCNGHCQHPQHIQLPSTEIEDFKKQLIDKINETISYGVNGDCGGRNVGDCKKELLEFVDRNLIHFLNDEDVLVKYMDIRIEKFTCPICHPEIKVGPPDAKERHEKYHLN